ncbi:MAG: hypothetical protein ACRDL7_04705, partial [Gaiellaceae bacterium]
ILAGRSEKEIEKLAEEPRKGSRSSALDYVHSLLKPAERRADLLMQAHRHSFGSRGSDVEARSHWERIRIAPEIELHVQRPLSKPDHRRLEELMKRVRELFPEGDTR